MDRQDKKSDPDRRNPGKACYATLLYEVTGIVAGISRLVMSGLRVTIR